MDVLHVMYGGPGGQFSIVAQLSQGLRERGLRSSACLYAPPGEFVTHSAADDAFDEVAMIEKRGRFDLSGSRRIGKAVDRHRPRAVMWHSLYAPFSLYRRRLTRAFQLLVAVEHQATELRSPGDRLRSAAAIAVSDSVIFVSQDFRARYALRKVPAPALRKARTIRHGIDLERFAPPPVSRAEPVLRMGSLTRMVPGKDFGSVILAIQDLRARKELPPFKLVLGGDGRDCRRWQGLVRDLELGEVIEFVGAVQGSAAPRFLQSLDIFIHPTEGESLSMAIIEAQAAGLPIVATDVPGVRGAVTDGVDGILVAPHDPGGLASVLAELLISNELREKFGKAARQTALRSHDRGRMVAEYLQLLAHLDPAGPWHDSLGALEPETGRDGCH